VHDEFHCRTVGTYTSYRVATALKHWLQFDCPYWRVFRDFPQFFSTDTEPNTIARGISTTAFLNLHSNYPTIPNIHIFKPVNEVPHSFEAQSPSTLQTYMKIKFVPVTRHSISITDSVWQVLFRKCQCYLKIIMII
jgi:hypothetical protein